MTVGLVFFADAIFDGNLYTRFPDTYKFMRFLPSAVWGAIYFCAGTTHLLSLRMTDIWVRKHILLLKIGLWIFLAGCVLYGDVYGFVGWLYIVFAVFGFISFLKLRNVSETNLSHYGEHLFSSSSNG